MPGGQCVFNPIWMTKDDYKSWLCIAKDRYKGRCFICDKDFNIGNMGESALKVHMSGKKHKMFMLEKTSARNVLQNYYQRPSQSSPLTAQPIVPIPTSNSSNQLSHYISNKAVIDAEILWALKCIKSHLSYYSCRDNNELFAKMFPDSVIAKQFSLSERKCSYLCTFGIAPYVKQLLLKNVEDSHFVLLFDESLNHSNQKKQLDIHVRFWNFEENLVKTQYLTSAFMGHSTANDLLNEFLSCVENFNLRKLIQISMDGPSVNWSFYGSLQKELVKNYKSHCVTLGSCGLHIMNNAFRKGVSSTDWDIVGLLTSLYWLLKDSPARREDFLKESSTKKLPVKFCNYRWLESIPAAERTILIWDDLKKYIRNVEIGKFSSINNKSFKVVVEASKDILFPVKLQFFLSVAKLLQPFMETYQSDKPLVSFLAEDIYLLIKNCLQLYNVLTSEALNMITSVENLHKFDFSEKKYFSLKSKVNVGFVAERMLKEMLQKKEISDGLNLSFKHECQIFVITMVKKMLEKSPLKYSLVCNASCINPKLLVSDEAKSCRKMKRVLFDFTQSNHINEKDCDEIFLQYKHFIQNIVRAHPSEFKNFNVKSTRLDAFLFSYFSQEKQYEKLWKVAKFILILSHGQASVERGFSINKQIEIENLKEESYISQRLIYDYVKSYERISDITISDELRKAAVTSRMKYEQYLIEERQKQSNAKSQVKRKEILDAVESMQVKKVRLQRDIEDIELTIDTLSEKAEADTNASKANELFMRANNFRKVVKEKTAEITKIESTITEKKSELNHLT